MTLAVPEKSIGRTKSSRVHLWIVPARVEGLWCGASGRRRAILRLRQEYQFVQGEIEIDGQPNGAISGRIEGTNVAIGHAGTSPAGQLHLQSGERGLRSTQASGIFDAAKDFAWRRAKGAACVQD